MYTHLNFFFPEESMNEEDRENQAEQEWSSSSAAHWNHLQLTHSHLHIWVRSPKNKRWAALTVTLILCKTTATSHASGKHPINVNVCLLLEARETNVNQSGAAHIHKYVPATSFTGRESPFTLLCCSQRNPFLKVSGLIFPVIVDCSVQHKYLCTPQNETPITIRTVFPLFFRSLQERLMNEQYLAAVATEPSPVCWFHTFVLLNCAQWED